MERRTELTLLLDFYGPLLTETRAKVLSFYCEEDLSLQEIAEETGVTRQAVYDAVFRAEAQLDKYERMLGMVARYRRIQAEIGVALSGLSAVKASKDTEGALKEAVAALNRIEWIEGSNHGV